MDPKNYLINLGPLNAFAKRLFIILIIATTLLHLANYFDLTTFNISFRIQLFYVNWYMTGTYALLKYAKIKKVVYEDQVKDFGEVTFLAVSYSTISFILDKILFA